jgi:3-hydroxyacyl-CoA dehydrogenase
LPSKEVDELVARFAKPDQVPFVEKQIVERILFALVNEGFKILEEGIARQPSDIDVVYLYGYGWPMYRGGPMFWADHEVGLGYLLSRLLDFSRQFPDTDYYRPSALLNNCVKRGLMLEEYYAMGLHKEEKTQSRL